MDNIISLRLNSDLKKAIEQLAQRESQTINGMLNMIIEVGIRAFQKEDFDVGKMEDLLKIKKGFQKVLRSVEKQIHLLEVSDGQGK